MLRIYKKAVALGALSVVSLNLIAQIPTDSLIRKYPFTGTVLDYSGKDFHGTIENVEMSTDRFNNIYSSYFFPKNEADFIEIPTEGLLIEEYTYSVWAKLASYPSIGSRYAVFTLGSTGADLTITYDNNYYDNVTLRKGWTSVQYSQISNNQELAQSNAESDLHEWTHIAVTRSLTQFKIYINGVLKSTVPVTSKANYGSGTKRALVGKRSAASGFAFDGDIDDLYIYKRSLSAAEVKMLFEEGICKEEISVTDTLIINLNITGFSPLAYENTIKLYPNPASDKINMDFGDNFKNLDGYRVKITTQLGAEVYNQPITNKSETINLTGWSGVGLYFVYIIDADDNLIETRKIILE